MTSETTVRFLLVDDHEVVRRGLRALLETYPGWEVCGEAADGRMAVRLAMEMEPQVVIMDPVMPHLNGFEATRQILQKHPQMHVLILSMHESEQLIREIISTGVRGYVLKSDAGRDLIAAAEALLRGESFFTSKLASSIFARESKRRVRRRELRPSSLLTAREREILQLLAEGKTNRAVAEALNISVKTAETHRARIMRKLAVDSIANLVRYAIRNGIVMP